jgi:hypothetical protein
MHLQLKFFNYICNFYKYYFNIKLGDNLNIHLSFCHNNVVTLRNSQSNIVTRKLRPCHGSGG